MRHTSPPPPSSRSKAPIPPEFDALILDCLAIVLSQEARARRVIRRARG
jgi:hypothetical protein